MNQSAYKVLLSPLFVCALFLLLLNDFLLKHLFGNWATGKLSDVAGLFAFSIFWTAFAPKHKKLIFVLTAIGFAFWKLPASRTFIDVFNSYSIYQIGRVEDWTDLAALLILPAAYLYEKRCRAYEITDEFKRRLAAAAIACVSLFAFTATQQVPDSEIANYQPRGHVRLENEYVYRNSKPALDREFDKLDGISDLEKETYVFDGDNDQIEDTFYTYKFRIRKSYCGADSISVHADARDSSAEIVFTQILLSFECREENQAKFDADMHDLFNQSVASKIGLTERQRPCSLFLPYTNICLQREF